MTTATKVKAPKVSATISNVIVDAYSKLVNLEGEQAFISLCVKRLKANTSSVRDIQASIEKAGGTAPTIRKAHVQYFITMQEILDTVAGAKSQPISELLKMAQRFQTSVGKENVASELEGMTDYAELVKNTPTLDETRTRKNAKSTPAPASLENIFIKTLSDINAYKGQGSVQSLKTTDLQTLATLAELIRVIAINSGLKPKAKA
jgi:hypothetical protein